ncbi:MAG: J domain-containing protein [Holophagales bacterium]|nr:J domain-containing protein [Holophagales bacterium]
MSGLRGMARLAVKLRRSAVGRKAAERWQEARDAFLEGRDGRRPPPRPPADGPGVDPQLAEWYANLELPYGADLDEVTRAWKRLLRRYHPDRHGADPERDRQATQLAQALNQAYEGLRRHCEHR